MGKKNTTTFNDFGSAFSNLGFGDVVKSVEENKKKIEEKTKIEQIRAHNREIYSSELELIHDMIDAALYLRENIGENVTRVYQLTEYAYNDHKNFGKLWIYGNRLKILSRLKKDSITEEEVDELIKEYNNKYSEIINR